MKANVSVIDEFVINDSFKSQVRNDIISQNIKPSVTKIQKIVVPPSGVSGRDIKRIKQKSQEIVSQIFILDFNCDCKLPKRQVVSVEQENTVLFEVIFVLIEKNRRRCKLIVAESYFKQLFDLFLSSLDDRGYEKIQDYT
jgi:hypothetical protein